MFMIMFVLNDPGRLDAVLDAWSTLGVSGVTIVESTGIYRRRVSQKRIPARFALGGLAQEVESSHFTLHTIVQDIDLVQQCLVAAEQIVGDLDQPHTGVLAAWPLALVKGVPSQAVEPETE